MRCPDCQQEWTPPPDACPHCAPEEQRSQKFNRFVLCSVLLLPVGPMLWIHTYSSVVPLSVASLSIGLAIYGMSDVRRHPQRSYGGGCAVFPIAFSLLALYLLVISRYHGDKDPPWTLCMSNQKQIAQAAMMNAQEQDEVLPSVSELLPLVPEKVLRCSARCDIAVGYGYNQALQGRKLDDIVDASIMLLSADGGNAAHLITGPSDIVTTRHSKQAVIAFVDGHAELLAAGKLATVRLSPAGKGK